MGRNTYRLFAKEDIQRAGELRQDAFATTIITEMQTKTTVTVTSYLSEWPSSICHQAAGAGEAVERREPRVRRCGVARVELPVTRSPTSASVQRTQGQDLRDAFPVL